MPRPVAEKLAETALYPAVKRFLEAAGWVVKGEVRGCDVVAVKDGKPLIVELKLALNLDLVLQGVERLAVSDQVYLAVAAAAPKRRARLHDRRVRKLLRLVGLGLLSVSRSGRVEVLLEPAPYRPRPDKRRRAALILEHGRRSGDGTAGGSTRRPIVTAYREDALRCAAAIAAAGIARPAELRAVTGVAAAASILQRNVYGWFVRIERGRYGLTADGQAALVTWAEVVAGLERTTATRDAA